MTPLEEVGYFADLPIQLNVELARKVMSVREILALEQGSILEMNRSAGENIDLHVEGVLIGFGEIVIIEDAMGIRVTDFQTED